ncbi:MAG: RecQ family ATP-dependent DNA helicase, partial [Oscillospiraceae bacterium]|nr:RecQ family ATP-dependent DNA helicase [Oscillospiraceae bacterium]
MATKSYSASYTNCLHNFVIAGLPVGSAEDKLLHSFTCVIKNILSRNKSINPSSFLRKTIGEIPANEPPLALVSKDAALPRWENTIKGGDNGDNPARDFYYSDELWNKYFSGYEWVRQLMIPEAPLGEILDSDIYRKSEQAVDFYLPGAKLVIEIDGVQHNDPGANLKDYHRDQALEDAGITVIRIHVSDYKNRTLTFENRLRKIRETLEGAEEIQIIQRQLNANMPKKRLLYENILRYEFLILELIDRGQLHVSQKKWLLQVPENGQRFVQLACEDLFLYYKNLYQLKGMTVEMPVLTFTDESGAIKLRNYLFSRPDERKVSCPTVFTSAWDGKDYYKVSCGKPVDYEIPWPIPDTDDRGSALKFFLYELFGYNEFKNGQWQIISNILLLRRTIGILPTGGGKSLCYQLAAMLQPGITLVICPINSLQIDQKRNLDEAGIIHTDYIASIQDATTKAGILDKLEKGQEQFVWISPERFQSRAFRKSISTISKNLTIAYNVIDEVHCLSEWGHDFRTSYLTLISSLEKTCPDTTIIGLTATASQAVLEDLKVEFGIDGSSIRSLPSLERSNLTFRVLRTTEKEKNEELDTILRHHDYGKAEIIPETGLVFTLTKDQTGNTQSFSRNRLAGVLKKAFPENEEEIGRFHSDAVDKIEVQNRFLAGDLRLLSTTKAFGMGVNKRDLRFTVHYSLPWSTESFYQEAGRAGRDDEPAECTILYTPDQFGTPDAINKVFDQHTSSENIKELVDQKQLKGDLSTIFYLWGGNNKGVYTDVEMIGKLLNRINETPPQTDLENDSEYFTVFSDFADKADNNLAHPHRLT